MFSRPDVWPAARKTIIVITRTSPSAAGRRRSAAAATMAGQPRTTDDHGGLLRHYPDEFASAVVDTVTPTTYLGLDFSTQQVGPYY